MAVNQQKLLGKTTTVQSAKVAPQQQLVAAPADTAALQDISKSLTRILQLLTQQNTQVTNEANQERKNQEAARRKKIELGLEGSFAVVKNAAQAIVAPVKNILDQIIQFFVTLFLGKALLNLIDWFANPENQSKVRSIARFLRDWWPSLIAGYILFGTGFGRAVRSLVGIAARSVMLLGGVALKLTGAIARAIGLKKAGTALSALGGAGGGLKGILAKLVVGSAVAAGGAVIAKNMMGGGGEEAPQLDVPAAPALPIAEAFGGGLIDFKTMLAASGGQVDSKLGILTQLFGSGGFASLLHGVPGVVSGPKGIDKVPAMLTDGEFVMSRGAVQKFGVNTLESMNAAGGGTNRPKIVSRKIYANSGGFIGSSQEKNENEQKQLFGPGAMPRMSSQEDMNNVANQIRNEERIKRIKNQVQSQRALASGSGINIRGATFGAQLGTGYSAKYRGRDAVLIKNGAKNFSTGIGDKEITLAGKRYYAQKKGNDVIYVLKNTDHSSKFAGSRDAAHERAKAITGDSSGFSADRLSMNLGNIFSGPRMQARQDYAASKGKYYSSSDQKTYANENDAKAAKQSRMTSLASQQRLDKLSNKGAGPRGGLGVRAKAESASQREDFEKRGGLFGQIGRGFTSMFGSEKDKANISAQDKASQVRTKQAGAESIGKYYSSSDGKYYGNYEQAQKARQARLGKTPPKQKSIGPPPKPAPKVITVPPAGSGGRQNLRGGGSKPKIPSVPAGKENSKTAKQLGIK